MYYVGSQRKDVRTNTYYVTNEPTWTVVGKCSENCTTSLDLLKYLLYLLYYPFYQIVNAEDESQGLK